MHLWKRQSMVYWRYQCKHKLYVLSTVLEFTFCGITCTSRTVGYNTDSANLISLQ